MPVREGVSSFSQSTIHQSGSAYRPLVSSLYACLEKRIVLESVHSMSVWKGILSLSHSTICPCWSQSTFPAARTILQSIHYTSVLEGISSLSHSNVCLSQRAYHPWVTPLYVCPARVPSVLSLSERTIIPKSVHYRPPVARTTLKSVHIGLFWSAYDSWFSPLCAVQKGVTSLIQSIIWLAGKAYHPWGNPLHVYFYFCCVISALNKDTDCYFIQIPYGQVVCFYVLCCVGSRFSNYVF